MQPRLNQLEFIYEKLKTLEKIQDIVSAWKKTSRVDHGRFIDEVTTRYLAWQAKRVKDVVCPLKSASTFLIGLSLNMFFSKVSWPGKSLR